MSSTAVNAHRPPRAAKIKIRNVWESPLLPVINFFAKFARYGFKDYHLY